MRYFYKNIALDVPKTVYCPREDSELMASVIEGLNLQGKRCLDMGCGCGLLSLIMAQSGADVVAADLNPLAVEAAKANAEMIGVRLHAKQSDLFSDVKGSFDLIVFNAPYLPEDESQKSGKKGVHVEELAWNGGQGGREVISRFARDAPTHLEKDGTILLEISSLTGENEVQKIFEGLSLRADVISREKIPWEELIILRIR